MTFRKDVVSGLFRNRYPRDPGVPGAPICGSAKRELSETTIFPPLRTCGGKAVHWIRFSSGRATHRGSRNPKGPNGYRFRPSQKIASTGIMAAVSGGLLCFERSGCAGIVFLRITHALKLEQRCQPRICIGNIPWWRLRSKIKITSLQKSEPTPDDSHLTALGLIRSPHLNPAVRVSD